MVVCRLPSPPVVDNASRSYHADAYAKPHRWSRVAIAEWIGGGGGDAERQAAFDSLAPKNGPAKSLWLMYHVATSKCILLPSLLLINQEFELQLESLAMLTSTSRGCYDGPLTGQLEHDEARGYIPDPCWIPTSRGLA